MAKDEMKDLERMIGTVPKFFRELTINDPKMYEMVMKLESYIWDDGALTRQTKKLIAIAIAAGCAPQPRRRAFCWSKSGESRAEAPKSPGAAGEAGSFRDPFSTDSGRM